jgi:hypothetical protein
MPAIRDLICDGDAKGNRHIQKNVYFAHVDHENGPCPVCGAKRTLCLLFGGAPAVKLFTPFFHDGWGMVNDQADWDRLRGVLARKHGCSPDDFVMAKDSKTEAKTTADEHLHRAWLRDKAKGLDSKQVREIRSTGRKYGVNPLNGRKARRKPRKEA